jgi:hypothetical protein
MTHTILIVLGCLIVVGGIEAFKYNRGVAMLSAIHARDAQ